MLKKQNIFQRTFSFSGEMEMGEFWSNFFVRMISCICAVIVLCILLAVIVPSDTEVLIDIANGIMPVFCVLWMLPIIPQTRRRLRDAGHSAKSYLWLLLPGVGVIVFVVLLCSKSVDTRAGKSPVR